MNEHVSDTGSDESIFPCILYCTYIYKLSGRLQDMPFRPAVPYMKQTKHTSTLKFILVMFNVRMIPQYRHNHTMRM